MGVRRLELICMHAIRGSVDAVSAVPLLEASAVHNYNHPHLFGQCRRYIAQNGAEVKKAGGLEQLSDFPVTKGLLGDAMDRCEQLEEEEGGTAASSGSGFSKSTRDDFRRRAGW